MDIKYVMAAPGMGKTMGAVNMMHAHLQAIQSDPSAGSIFYVAPSRQLLKQTWNNLLAQLGSAGNSDLFKQCKYIVGSKIKGTAAVAARLYAHLDVCESSIVFITHNGFLKLRNHPRFANTTVIFDETRQWVTPVSNIRFSAETRRLFDELFTTHKLNGGALCTVSANQIDINEVRRSLRSTADDRAYSALLAFHKLISIDPKYGEPRVSAYGALTRTKNSTYTMVKVEVPYLPFRGFKDVYVLSARFKSSQMFHLLYKESVENPNLRLVDYSRAFLSKWIPNPSVVSQKVANRYRKMVIVPLLGNDDRVLSVHALNAGFIARSMPAQADAQWFKDSLVELREAESTGSPEAASNQLRQVYGVTTDIMSWMLDSSLAIHEKWVRRNPCGVLPLTFTNHGDQKQSFEFYSRKDRMLWVNHADSRGSNGYMNSNAVFYLTAVNAHPIVKQVLDFLSVKKLPDGIDPYDCNQDYVVDSALQCIGRGSVRDQESDRPMLVVVPTIQLANYLKASLTARKRSGGRVLEYAPHVDLRFVNTVGMALQSTVSLNMKHKLPGTDYLTEEETKRLAAIRTAKTRARKAGDTERFDALEAERIAIRTQAAGRVSSK